MKSKPNIKRLPIGKRKFVGGAVAAVGMVTSIIGKAQEAKKQKRLEEEQRANARANILTQDMNAEAGITAEQDALYGLGNYDADLYAKGGNLRKFAPNNLRGSSRLNLPMSTSNTSKNTLSHTANEVISERVKSDNYNLPSQTGFSAVGGNMNGIASGTDVASGNTHESKAIDGQYGITINDGTKDIAEIENKEVVKEDVVFSDRLKFKGNQTYASKAEDLARKRGKLEKDLEGVKDTRRRNSLERQISILDNQENALYVDQENSKLKQGLKDLGKEGITEEILNNQVLSDSLSGEQSTPEFAEGGGFWDNGGGFDTAMGYAQQVVPLIDNISNAFRKNPKLSTPLIAPMERLDTNVNIEPQIASVRRAVGASTRNILDNSNNAQVARASITNAKLKGSAMEGEIRASRDNTVRGINNQNVQMANQKMAGDTNTFNQHNMLQYQRSVGIQDRKSGNVANFVDDLKGMINESKIQKNFDESTVTSIMADKTGATLRSYLNNPYFMSELNRNPQLKARLESIAIEQDKGAWDSIFGSPKVSTLDINKAPMQWSNSNINNSIDTSINTPNFNFVKPRLKI